MADVAAAFDLGLAGLARLGQATQGGQGLGPQAVAGRAPAAVELEHGGGRRQGGLGTAGGEVCGGLGIVLVPPAAAVARQPGHRLAILPIREVDLGDDHDHRHLRQLGDAGQGPLRFPGEVAVPELGQPPGAGAAQGESQTLPRPDRRHVGRESRGLEQVPVVAGEDHQQVGRELQRALDGLDHRRQGLVGARQVDDFVGARSRSGTQPALEDLGRRQVRRVEVARGRRFAEVADPRRARRLGGLQGAAPGVMIAERMGLGPLEEELSVAVPRLPDADRVGSPRAARHLRRLRRRLVPRLERLGELQQAGGTQALRRRQQLGELVAGASSRV